MLTKRTALKAAVATGVTVFSGLVPGVKDAAAQTLRVRRSVNSMRLGDPDLSTYRDFVGLMRNKPQTDRVSWLGLPTNTATRIGFSALISHPPFGRGSRPASLPRSCAAARQPSVRCPGGVGTSSERWGRATVLHAPSHLAICVMTPYNIGQYIYG
jgi:hypothetical protein